MSADRVRNRFRMMRRLAGLVPFAMAILVSCGGGPEAPIDRSTFEDVMVELRKAGEDSDSAAFVDRRRDILEAAGITDSLLFAFVRAHSEDVEYMQDVWTSIDARVNGAPEDEESDTAVVR